MDQLNLFKSDELKALEPPKPKERCKHCDHIHIVSYGIKRFFYCKMQGCNRTENGMQKIKFNDFACEYFSE